jgi:glycosyltransferase involved in cell wall biosynthesis
VKIGLTTSVIQRGKTGIAQYVFALLRALLAQADKLELTLFVLEEDVPLFSFAGTRANIVTVPEQFRPPIRNILWHQTALPGLARRHQLDVLHVPSYRRLLWPRPCPLVATIHDLAPFRLAGKYDRARMFYGRVVARRLARRLDRIIAVSHTTARDIAAFFNLPPERVTVVHNGLDHDRFHTRGRSNARTEIAGRYGFNQPFILYVARLEHPGKNHVRLIAAFNQFKQRTGSPWQLVLGGGDWHGAESIHAAIRASPYAADIRVLGFVHDAELPSFYRAAEVFVFPSLYEGFGMPPTEAMACGCPVICSTRGSLGEVIGDAAAIIDPENPDSMADRLVAVAGDSGLRERLALAGLSQAAKFNWERTAAETLAVYKSVVPSPKRRNAPAELAHHHGQYVA